MTEIAFIPPPAPTPAPPTAPPGTIVLPIRIAPILVPLAQLIIYLFTEHFRRQCEAANQKSDCYAAVPEWWAARPGYGRPQLILHFREKDASGNWKRQGGPSVITIPWGEYPEGGFITPPVPFHVRGKVLAEIPLNDNSKLRTFCVSEAESKRIIVECLKLVRTGYKPSDEIPSIKEMRNDSHFAEKTVYPFRAIYLPTGARTDPDNPPQISYFD